MTFVWASVFAVASALLLMGVWISCWSMRETAAKIRREEALDDGGTHRAHFETQSTSMSVSALDRCLHKRRFATVLSPEYADMADMGRSRRGVR